MKNPKKVSDGKKSRAQGGQFELKWTNNRNIY